MATLSSITDPKYYFSCCLLSLFSVLLFLFAFKKFTNTGPPLPPSPPALPLIGHLHHLMSSLKHKAFQDLCSRYGPLLSLRLGFLQCILVSSPSTVAEIFKTQDLTFSARPPSPLEDSLLFGSFGFSVAPYGNYWRFLKKLCVTELFSTQQIERSRRIRREEITRFLNKMIESSTRSKVADVGALLLQLSNNIICRMAVSTRCSEEDDESERIGELVRRSFELVTKAGFVLILGPFKKLGCLFFAKEANEMSKKYEELLEKLLKEHEERAKRGDRDRQDRDLMDILLEVYQDDNAELRITRTQIKAFILDLFLGGTGTSAETMQWAIAELINHPNIFKKVRHELELVVGTSRLVDESDIPNLPYLQAVVKETLRLHPNVPFIPRKCLQECKIQGFHIPKDSVVFVNAYAIMRDPQLWDVPNEFRPERFLVSSEKHDNMGSEIEGQNFDFVPFGGGRRACPGMKLAYAVMHNTIATIVQCFDLKVCEGREEVKVSMEEAKNMATLTMAFPLKCLPVVHFNPLPA